MVGLVADFAGTFSRLSKSASCSEWVCYTISVKAPQDPPQEVELQPVTEQMIISLQTHAESNENQLKSGLRFWQNGMHQAYIWMEGKEPLCIQWLLTSKDNEKLRGLPGWAGMYPPIDDEVGQVENLYAFKAARGRGVATIFEKALFCEAKKLGLSRLITHVHQGNEATHKWARKLRWQRCGTITLFGLDIRKLRGHPIYIHSKQNLRGDPVFTDRFSASDK